MPRYAVPVSNLELIPLIAAHQRAVAFWSKQHPSHRGPRPRCPERLAELILVLCTRLSNHQWFRWYSYKEDLVCEAVVDCLTAIEKFNCTRANPFAYLTTAAWRRMRRTCQREMKRGGTGMIGQPVEVVSMPGLALGNFDAGALSERFAGLGAAQPSLDA